MNNSRNGYSSVPNQPDSGSRPSGWRVPAFSSPNSWSRTDSIVNRRLLDDPQFVYSRTPISSTINTVQSPHTPHHIPIRNSNITSQRRRQHLETLRQTLPNTRSISQAREEDKILKHLTKTTYDPIPKSLLLRNLTLYYRNKNSRKARDLSIEEEDEKRCAICLEEFEPKETVMVTPCKHMFHEQCIVPWLSSKGQCPLCRFVFLKPEKRRDSSPGSGSNLVGDMTVNDLFTLELISVVRAMEETFLFGFPRRH